MRDNYVWVIGGGIVQRPLIQEYIKRGYEVVVSDMNRKCACADIATVWVINTRDWQSHISKALRIRNHPPSAVATAGTDAGHVVSYLGSIFNLPACKVSAAIDAKYKDRMREVIAYAHPWFDLPYRDDKVVFKAPCVVKSADSMASRGVGVVLESADMDAAVASAWEESWQGTSRIVIEELLIGDPHIEVTSDWFVVDGWVHYINGVRRIFPDFGISSGYISPYTIPEEIHDIARRAVTCLGVNEGPFKMDLMYDDRYGWCLLECATRWSGEFDHSIAAKYTTGRDLTSSYVDYTLGLGNPEPWDGRIDQFLYSWAPHHPGHIVGQRMIDFYRSHEDVVEVIPTGKSIPMTYGSNADRALFVMIVGQDEGDIINKAREMDITWQSMNT